MYTYEDVMTFVEEENVKFIRLAFCDIYGNQKNIAIMPAELERAFSDGISFDASAVLGFGDELHSDLFLRPDPSTLCILPWRPTNGRVVRMFCDILYSDGTPFEKDGRRILKDAVARAAAKGLTCNIGTEFEFYLFKTDEEGNRTFKPFDTAGYMDIAPEDCGENVRREICFTLLDMGIHPESSHHEEGPGQQEIDFKYSDPLSAADNAVTFKAVVKTIARRNGLYADFDPKPLPASSGNGMHINISVHSEDSVDHTPAFLAGILHHIRDITVFFNPTEQSYRRFGEMKAPKYISWSPENRSQLIRIPASHKNPCRIELRSPDPTANPYLAYALLIYAGLNGVEKNMTPPEPVNLNLFTAPPAVTDALETLPLSLGEARALAENSAFLHDVLPVDFLHS